MSSVSSSSRARPFTFDRSFDDPNKIYLPGEKFGPKIEVNLPKKQDDALETETAEVPEEEQLPPEPEKLYTEEDLEAAREEGQIAGHTAALEDAETAREHYVADALNMISQSLDGLEEKQAQANRETGEVAMRMVYAIVEKVLPEHAKGYVVDSMEALVREVLPLVYDEPTLVVRVHNMVAEDIQTKLDEICQRSNFNGTARVVPDYELQPGDCRVEWEGGGADRVESRLWSEIREIISDNVGPVDLEALDAAADAEVEADAGSVELSENVDHTNDAMDAATQNDLEQEEQKPHAATGENTEEVVAEPEQPADDMETQQGEGQDLPES
jgi:flagellar assembly protein FliH